MSLIGSALGGATFELELVGPIILFGVVLGVAQAPVLGRYLKDSREPIGTWVLVTMFWLSASFVGWFGGWVVFVLARALMRLLGLAEFVGLESPRAFWTIALVVVWVVFAAFQAVAIALAALTLGRRTLLPLAALWALAGTASGALASTVSRVIDPAMLVPGSGHLLLDRTVSHAIVQAAAGAIYGAATGVVLALIARRTATEEGGT